MMVDFFKKECQEIISHQKFGIFDAEDKTPAKIKLIDEDRWNATVINEDEKSITFTAIDNCIDVYKPNNEMDSRCDCMLTYDTTLLLIELKNKRESWQSEGLEQIENIAIRMKSENPDFYNVFKKRKAIVANRKNQFPSFHEVNIEQRQYFWKEYKMRIQFEAEIIIR